ncbi:MAG: GIY-YIG nuclease family protein [Azonexus sp.]
MTWIVYILRLRDNSLYCGITNNYAKRMQAHWAKKGSKYVASRLPILEGRMMLEFEGKAAKSQALKAEAHIKRLTKAKKEAWMTTYDPAEAYIRSL